MLTLRSTSPLTIFDRLEQQLQQQLPPAEHPPAAEVHEDGECYQLMLDLPGVQRDAIDVQASDRTLVVSAERRKPAAESSEANDGASGNTGKDGSLVFSEFHYGSWSRSFRFSTPIQRDQIQATYRDGVLTVVALKAHTVTSVAVQVEV